MEEAKPFWVSWYQPRAIHKTFEYHGPWWITGERVDDEAYTICAAVMAKDEDAAKRIIVSAFDADPGALEWRFVEQKDLPVSDRFPRADWMQWPWPLPGGGARP